MMFLVLLGVIFSIIVFALGMSGLVEAKKDEERQKQVLRMILKDCPPYGSGRHEWSIDPVSMTLICTKCNIKAGGFNE
jgi:NADH:ubiquinone oxidoreductase subunit 3 (subunit A)